MAEKITVYDWTGEYRMPKAGEWYLDESNRLKKRAEGELFVSEIDWRSPNRFILSPRQKEATEDE